MCFINKGDWEAFPMGSHWGISRDCFELTQSSGLLKPTGFAVGDYWL